MDQRFDDPPAASRLALPVGGVELSLIAGFDLRWQGRHVPVQVGAQQLIACLALLERPAQRRYLAGTLWPDSPDGRAMANLRSTLWRMRRTGCPIVQRVGEQLALAPGVSVDVRELADLAHRVFDSSDSADVAWLAHVAQGGELLPGWDQEWVVVERERLRQLRLHALELLCDRLAVAGQFGRAVETCLAAVAVEPLRESARRALIKVYLAEGNVGEAVGQYRAYRRLMRDELGLTPSRQMEDLVRDLRIG